MRELPDYAWCADDPRTLGVPRPAGEPPVPRLADPDADALPAVGVTAPGRTQPLVRVRDPRIRTVAAYWREGWPAAVPGAWLRSGAMARLVRAADSLPGGFGLAVWDAWRSPALQARLHDDVYRLLPGLPAGFVSAPSADPRFPPPHATGGTVDVTLSWTGRPLALGTGFDSFVPMAHADALESGARDADALLVRDLRRLLRRVMVEAGFVQLACEWWHFEYGTRLWAAIKRRDPVYPAAALEAD